MEADLDALRDHVRIWRVDPVGHTETLLAVARRLAATSGLDSVRTLTEEGESCSRTRLAALVSAVADDLDVAPGAGIEAQTQAVEAMARRALAAEITPRELTYWVTRVVGLRGGEGTPVFLALEQEYCDRLGDEDVSDLDVRTTQAAAAYLAGPAPAERRRGLRGALGRLAQQRQTRRP